MSVKAKPRSRCLKREEPGLVLALGVVRRRIVEAKRDMRDTALSERLRDGAESVTVELAELLRELRILLNGPESNA